MNTNSLSDELESIDAAINHLDDRRIKIIHRMGDSPSRDHAAPTVLEFPNRVVVRKSPHDANWPKGLEADPLGVAIE